MRCIPPRRCCAIGGRPRTRCTSVLLDRFRRNLRRAAGRNVQYFGRVEPQRRLAPHARFAMRRTITRGGHPPTSSATRTTTHSSGMPKRSSTLDPQTRTPLPTKSGSHKAVVTAAVSWPRWPKATWCDGASAAVSWPRLQGLVGHPRGWFGTR
nr:replication initiator [Dactylosporangium sucinum]